MGIFESILALLVVAVGLAALARRWNAPYPSLLAGLGIVLALVPGTPRIMLDPALALALFVAPVLLDAAFDASTRDLRREWVSIATLVVAAVGVTTVAVAWTAKLLVPELPWAAAIALGAIVSPPDAAAATTILKQAKLPHRLTQILEGESLFNDASALLVYRVAVGLAMDDGTSLGRVAPLLVLALVASVAGGVVFAKLFSRLLRDVDDVPTAIILQFAGTFGLWIVADRVGLSPILAVAASAMTLARIAPHRTPARIRVPTYAVWETVVFTLNVLAFILIGLQLRPIVEHLSPDDRLRYAEVAAAVLGVVVAVRLAWVAVYGLSLRWRASVVNRDRPGAMDAPTLGGGLLIGWCGMRGIVTLAAALALPDGDHPFPGRDLILVAAFVVVVGTLVVQGLTLGPLLARLGLEEDRTVDDEIEKAREATLRAAIGALDGDDSKSARILRYEYQEALEAGVGDDESAAEVATQRLRRKAVDAARAELKRLRLDETIGDDAYHRLEMILDRAELYSEIPEALSGAEVVKTEL